MRVPARGRRLLSGEGGFTLTEMLVTIMIMIVVTFALYGIFDMTIRVYDFGNDKVEAVESARLGLEKMEREIRAAHPYNKANSWSGDDHLFFGTSNPAVGTMPAAAQITFGNDRSAQSSSGHMKVECPGLDGRCEFITYKLTSAGSNSACAAAPCTLRRVNSANSSDLGDALIENVAPGGLNFTYLKANGSAASAEADVRAVLIQLQVNVDGRTQRLATNVTLRNMGL